MSTETFTARLSAVFDSIIAETAGRSLKILSERYRNKRKRFGLGFNLIAGICNFELYSLVSQELYYAVADAFIYDLETTIRSERKTWKWKRFIEIDEVEWEGKRDDLYALRYFNKDLPY